MTACTCDKPAAKVRLSPSTQRLLTVSGLNQTENMHLQTHYLPYSLVLVLSCGLNSQYPRQ